MAFATGTWNMQIPFFDGNICEISNVLCFLSVNLDLFFLCYRNIKLELVFVYINLKLKIQETNKMNVKCTVGINQLMVPVNIDFVFSENGWGVLLGNIWYN